MRFILEFVSCCGPPVGSREEVINTEEKAGRPGEEARAALVTPTSTLRSQRRKRRIRAADSGLDWKPTLRAISEDTVVPEEQRPERAVKRKGSAGGTRDVSTVPAYADDYRRSNHFPTVIPAFSATPFMI
ncbi:hypothetical protein Tsubulata_030918 [Turnera subulata]|uniref:Uncharacterized protein n=1 Tax=Turnera subulata TaxID=218843 RepID=A0A9Q0GDX1_9ROSI|nr:hypothetical protein Tsubulata_030918 [Turnera subulata]